MQVIRHYRYKTTKQDASEQSVQSNIASYFVYYAISIDGRKYKRIIDYRKRTVRNEGMRSAQRRELTFLTNPSEPIPRELAQSYANTGFYRTGNGEITCIFCTGKFAYETTGKQPKKIHKKLCPTCPLLLNLDVLNVPIVNSFSKIPNIDADTQYDATIQAQVIYQIDDTVSKNWYQMVFTTDRRRITFEKFEELEYLAEQGLFLISIENEYYLKCSECLKETYLLEGIDQRCPEQLHLVKCEYSTIKNLKPKFQQHCKISYGAIENDHQVYQESRIATLIIQSYPTKRYNIQQYIKYQVETKSNWSPSVYELLQNLDFIPPPETIESEKNSLHELYLDRLECKICLMNKVQVIFLPCGHLGTCELCAAKSNNCPICRARIERRVTNFQFAGENDANAAVTNMK